MGVRARVPGSGRGAWRITSLSLFLVIFIAACSGGRVEITEARLGVPTGPNAALYFTASGGADRLLGATTNVSDSIQIHASVANDDGTMGMQQLPSLELTADEELVLEPGGYHLMLIDVDSLEVGESIEVTLVWEKAGEITLDAEVVSPADAVHGG